VVRSTAKTTGCCGEVMGAVIELAKSLEFGNIGVSYNRVIDGNTWLCLASVGQGGVSGIPALTR